MKWRDSREAEGGRDYEERQHLERDLLLNALAAHPHCLNFGVSVTPCFHRTHIPVPVLPMN